MILYYALGGGLGHLTRARAVAHTLGLGAVTLLTASPFAADPRVTGDFAVGAVPPALATDREAWRAWLLSTLNRLAPAALYLDAFPLGIQGELGDLPLPAGLPIYHLARRLRWDVYRAQAPGTPPPLDTAYLLEPLEPAHEAFLRAHARRVAPLVLSDPPSEATTANRALAAILAPAGQPLWLIVHAGSAEEIGELLAYAGDLARLGGVSPALVLVAPQQPADLPAVVRHLDLYPATPLFPLADRIITAAGFNAMRQLAPYREKHSFLPFPRRFDDQFARAAWVRG